MKKPLIISIIFFSIFIKSYSQKQDYQWIFGDSCGIDFSNPSNPVTYMSAVHNMDENFASIADEQGNLVCYVNGSPLNQTNLTKFATVYNSSHVIIVNGDSIFSDYSQTQGSLLIPFP